MHDDLLTLESVDQDGAIRETFEAAAGESRADLLRKAFLLGGGLVSGTAVLGLLAESAEARHRRDVSILNFALTLEYLEAAFYTEARRRGALSGATAEFARVVGAHERAHVAVLKRVLGRSAVRKPKFDFRDTTESQAKFQRTAMSLEDVGVTAYQGQAPRISAKAVLAAAGGILAVEARHAAWIRDIIGDGDGPSPAPAAFNPARTKAEVLRVVNATGFIVRRPPRRGSRRS
ncbi:MAG: ferritin-like domain-containing protein [Actinomycetota bacterium]|nr:ferritin-like domain-containing protein [Actinomycetota bacterium]